MINPSASKKKKRVKRGKKKKKSIRLYYNNINGLSSKTESLKKIVGILSPDIVALCETKLAKSTKGVLSNTFHNSQYKVIPRFTKAGKEGLVVAVKHNAFKSVLDVTSTQLNTILSVRLVTGSENIRLILGYAPQEDDDEEVREEFFQELELELRCCVSAGDLPIVVGDFNAKLEANESPQGFPTSDNGRLFYNSLKEYDLSVLNFTAKCRGKLTHVIRTTGASSVLDYCAVSNDRMDSISTMQIDESTLYCPFRVIHTKNKNITKLSDHNAMIMNMVVPRVKATKTMEPPKWSLSDEKLSLFQSEFNNKCENIGCEDPQEMYNKFESVTHMAMDNNLKTKPLRASSNFCVHKKFHHVAREITNFAAKGKVQRKVACQYRQKLIQLNTDEIASRNMENLVKAVQQLSENDQFSVQKFWRAKQKLSRGPKSVTSVYRKDGEEVFNDPEIICKYREEFEERLSSVLISTQLSEYKLLTDKLYEMIVKEATKNEQPDFTMDELDHVIVNLKDGASGPDHIPPKIFKKGGQNLRIILLEIINKLKKHKCVPVQWEDTDIIPLYKNKGPRKCLVNQRGIFLTQVASKIWERMIKIRCECVLNKINALQSGGRKNKSTGDELFLLRACIDHAKYMNKPLYVNFYDFRQCFDKLWLEDSIISLYKLGLTNEFLSLIACTNSRASITVQTPLGPTTTFTKRNIAKQGSVTAPTLCSASVAELCDEGIEGGIAIGTAFIGPLAYLDDVTTANTSIKDAVNSNLTVCFFSDKKKQPLNETKCFLLPINVKPSDSIPAQEVNGQRISIKTEGECLGDIFNSKGNYSDLIKARYRKGTVCLIEAIAACSNSTMGKFAIHSLLTVYKSVFLRIVLFNSETWNNLTVKNLEKLSSIQMKYLKRMLHCPRGTSNSFILLELGLLPIEDELAIRQLMFLHHIIKLPDEDAVKKVFEQQGSYPFEENWRKHIFSVLDLTEDLSLISACSWGVWKARVKKAVVNRALSKLNDQCLTQSKTTLLCPYVKLETQSYVTDLPPQKARTLLQLRGGIYNIKGNRPFQYADLSCRLCKSGVEDFEHVVNVCPNIHRNGLRIQRESSLKTAPRNELLARIQHFKDLVDSQESK